MKIVDFETRRAQPSDADDIAEAHRASIQSIGPRFCPPNVVNDWGEGLERDVYVKAMEKGEVFFIAVGEIAGRRGVLGFATDYCVDSSQHGTSVYVRGPAARHGIGSALFRLAEAHAVAAGATSIRSRPHLRAWSSTKPMDSSRWLAEKLA